MPTLGQELSFATLKVEYFPYVMCVIIIATNFISISCHSLRGSVRLNYMSSISGYCSYLKALYTKLLGKLFNLNQMTTKEKSEENKLSKS